MQNLKIFLIATTAITTTTFGLSAQQGDKFFDGWYGGIEAGYDRTELNPFQLDESFYYGLNLGYRYQTNSGIVYGLEGSFGRTEFDDGFSLPESFESDLENEFQWSTSAILGFTSGKNLFFSKVGLVGSQFESESGGTIFDGTVREPSENSFHEEGLLLGAGYERAISDRLSFTLGFDYITYGNGFDQYQPKAGIKLKF